VATWTSKIAAISSPLKQPQTYQNFTAEEEIKNTLLFMDILVIKMGRSLATMV
jgi:hypothetical protein